MNSVFIPPGFMNINDLLCRSPSMSTYSPTPEVDLPVHYARHAFTPREHAELGLNPDIDLQAPPLSSSQVPPASSSPPLPLPYYPNLVIYPVLLNRHICDLNTPSYKPKPILWTPENGEIPDPDTKVYTADVSRSPMVDQVISRA